LPCREIYVADLDAIEGADPAWDSLSAIAGAGMRLWVDAGIRNVRDAERLAVRSLQPPGKAIDRLIVGLESIAGPSELGTLTDFVGPEHLVFSLDLKAGWPVARSPQWQDTEPIEIVGQVYGRGIRSIIVLDLAQVGMGRGVSTLPLCRQIAKGFGGVEVITGGGVASRDDLIALAEAGVDAALVASALHDGRVRRTDIEEIEAR